MTKVRGFSWRFGEDENDTNEIVKIPKPTSELLKGDFETLYTIKVGDLKKHMYYDKFPLWRNKSSKEFSLHGLGLIDNNKSKPQQQTLHDTSPHMMLGGATGHGKSVTLNDIIIAGAIVHPPWKVQYYLNNPKIVEFKKYGMHPNLLPHLNVVAATVDPQYSISLLEYIMKVMNDWNKIFTLAKVNNIEEFTKKTGLHMPMLVLVLDELRYMYLNAANDVIRSGPEYGVYTILIASPLQNCGLAIASGYKHLLFYSVVQSAVTPYKIQEYWPEYKSQSTWIYVNKDLPADYCFTLKYPTIVALKGG